MKLRNKAVEEIAMQVFNLFLKKKEAMFTQNCFLFII